MIIVLLLFAIFLFWFINGNDDENKNNPIVWILLGIIVIAGILFLVYMIVNGGFHNFSNDSPIGK